MSSSGGTIARFDARAPGVHDRRVPAGALLLWLAAAACGLTSPVADGGVDADADVDRDAEDVPGDAPGETFDPGRCGEADLVLSRTEDEVTAAGERFLAGLRAAGAPSAYIDGGVRGTSAHLFVQAVNYDLGVARDADPGPAVLAWLAAVADSPIRVAEYVPNPDRPGAPDPAGYLAGFVRTTIDGAPFPAAAANLEGFYAQVQASGSTWRVGLLDVTPEVAFATRDDALLQARCTPPGPPPEGPLRAFTFHGLELDGCVEVGTYDYVPRALDRLEWGGRWAGVVWFTGSDVSAAGHRAWVPQRDARLLIDPADYWPRIGYADCSCGDGHTGFTLVVQALTGAVLHWTAGVGCVVC